MRRKSLKRAILAAAKIVHFHDHLKKLIFFIIIVIANNKPPPIAERIVATAIGETPCSKYVWAVPVIPHKIAASNTNNEFNIFQLIPASQLY